MYHIIETGAITTLLYLLSYILSRLGYFSTGFHRKLWNSLLAGAFILAAGAGLFIALQIKYKWDITWIKTVLQWHVEFGTALAFTGVFHLSWHYSYFRKILSSDKKLPQPVEFTRPPAYNTGINLFIVGLISSSFQLLLIREMMNITGGYELIAGIFLGSWLLASAAGSSLAGRSELSDLRKINLIFSVSPIVSILMMFLLAVFFLKPGQTPSFLASIVFTFLVLIPFCITSGFTFVRLISFARLSGEIAPGKSFSIETSGGIIAGILIPFFTSGLLNTYQVLLLVIMLSLGYTINTFFLAGIKSRFAVSSLIALLASAVIIVSPDIIFRQIFLSAIKVTSSEDTPYGNITKGTYNGEKSVYYNQRLIAYKNDVTEREENIHYAMLQREKHEKVILVSGSLESHLPELLKYNLKEIIFIERDPELARADTNLKNAFRGNLIVKNTDAFTYLKNSKEKVDAIILLIPPPTTLLLNRYYATEFFRNIKNALIPGGVFLCSPGPGDTYFNKGSLNLFSSVYNSLSAVFKNVRPVGGNKLYFIASDGEISVSFCSLTEKRGINNVYVSSDYLSDDLVLRRSEEITSQLDRTIKQNTNITPVAMFYQQAYSLSKNLNEKIPVIIFLFLVFLIPFFRVRKSNMIMYFSASALAGFEIISIFALQTIAGNMYQLAGLIIAGLMTGLAVGSGSNLRYLKNITTKQKGIILILFYTCTGLAYNYISNLKNGFMTVALIIVSVFIPAIFTGQIFRELTNNSKSESLISATYSADLAGSALGFILISGFVVPVFGMSAAILLSALFVFAGIIFGTMKSKP